MDEDDLTPEVFSYFSFSVKIVRVIEDIIVPSTLKFKMEFIPLETATGEEVDRAFAKMRYWIDNVVNRSVVFSHDNSNAIAMFIDDKGANSRVSNILMITPEEPDDQHMCAIFQSKLQALSGLSMAFGPVEVSGDNQIGLSFTFIGDSTSVLPDAKEWFQDTRTFFDKPWWERDDGSTLDVVPPEGADLSVKPAWAFSFDFLEPKGPRSSTADGKTNVIRTEFRPNVIDGGKGGKE